MRSAWQPRNWPLGVQLALGFALIVGLALGGGGLLLIRQWQQEQLAHRFSDLLARAHTATALVMDARVATDPDALALALFQFHEQTGVHPVVVDGDGNVRADSWLPSPLQGRRLALPEVGRALQGEEATGYRWLGQNGWVAYAAVPLPQGAGALLVAADLSDVDAGLRELKGTLLWVLTLAGLLATAAGWAVARYLARPLERLNWAAAELGDGRLATRVNLRGSREVLALGRRFNAMAAELESLDEQRRNFVAAASHEMRTPIASIQALTEGLLGETTGDVSLYREYLGDILQECRHTGHLVNRLLELARLEARRTHPDQANWISVQLCALVAEVVSLQQPVAGQRGVALVLEGADPIWLQTEPWLVELVLGNLVENACKYTPAGGSVRVAVTQESGAVRVAVQDTGPGIAPAHLPHLFERFYRVDRSRARATGGVGLGLAIAREAAAQLHGSIEVQSRLGFGTCFTLHLPTAWE